MEKSGLVIRDRRPGDLPAIVEIGNDSNPPDAHRTLEEAKRGEALFDQSSNPVRLIAEIDGQPVGFGSLQRDFFDVPGRHGIRVTVLPAYRRRGIGKSLYEQLMARSSGQEIDALAAWVHESNLELCREWLAREGFREAERMRKSELRLTDLDLAAMDAAEQVAIDNGIVFTTLEDEDTESNRRKLWELYNATHHDVPHDTVVDESYEQFEQMIERPECLRDCLVLARAGDEYAGFSILAEQTRDRAFTWMTGVDRRYRNRGIALAIKARSARLAQARGFAAMQTMNHVNNPAMLAVNTRIGYRPLPEIVLFLKEMGPARAQ